MHPFDPRFFAQPGMILYQVVQALHGYSWWLDFGQLLSLHRSGDQLPWADDWDFCVVAEPEELVRELSRRGIKARVLSQVSPYYNGRCHVKVGEDIDLFCCKPDLAAKKMRQLWRPAGGFDMALMYYDEFDTIPWKNLVFNVPRHLDSYLETRYESSWRTPIKKNMKHDREDFGPKQLSYCCLIPGVFDELHEGHRNIIEHGLRYFDHVIVGVHHENVVTYKEPPAQTLDERVAAIAASYPSVEVLGNCPLVTGREFLQSIGCDFVVFGREDGSERHYPDVSVNHPIDRFPGVSSRLNRQNREV